jgi:hypothetical protein
MRGTFSARRIGPGKQGAAVLRPYGENRGRGDDGALPGLKSTLR